FRLCVGRSRRVWWDGPPGPQPAPRPAFARDSPARPEASPGASDLHRCARRRGESVLPPDLVKFRYIPPAPRESVMLSSDILLRRETHFTLWRPSLAVQPPVLVIGTLAPGNPNTLASRKDIPLSKKDPKPGLWALAAAQVGIPDGIYHYWFQVENTNPADPA